MKTKILRRATKEDIKNLKKTKVLPVRKDVRKDAEILARLFFLVKKLENPPPKAPANSYWKKARRPKQIVALLRDQVLITNFDPARD